MRPKHVMLSKHLLMQPTAETASASTPARKSRMHADDRRRQLLRVAIEVFARNGFSGTKTKDIAAAAGVSEAILFRHFATKEDLYHAILDLQEDKAGAAERNRKLQAFMDARDDRGLFLHFARMIHSGFREDPAFQRLMLYASLEGHLLANLFRERFVLPTGNLLVKYITQRQKEGAFRECDPQVAVIFAVGTIVHFAMSRHVFGVKRAPVGDEATVEELVELILAGLRKYPRSTPNGKNSNV
jgi:TetR/AcrR family transcriptional regulator